MADRYFVNSSKVNEMQIVRIERNKERIVFIGSQIHRPINDAKSLAESIVLDVNKWSKMMFVHQGLREVILNKEKNWTVLLCIKGYTKRQIETIKKYFNNIFKSDGTQTVRKIKEITNLEEILCYINHGDEITNRRLYMIRKLVFYCHGNVRGLSPWMPSVPTVLDDYIDKTFVEKIEKYAFGPSSEIYSYACRSGLGNLKIDKDARGMNPMPEKSLAQAFADITGATVYAYLRRTWYGDSLLNSNERRQVENLSKISDYEKIKNNYLYEIWKTKKYEIDGEILYPKGARHPVRADETPIGVPSGMKIFLG